MPIPFLSSIGLNKNEVQDFKVFNLASDPTLTSGGDYGYFWLNTSGTKTLKFWDGASIRSLIDSTTISSSTAGSANDLTGGLAGSLPYQQGAGDTTFLGIGTADQVLTVNSGATAPQWLSQSSLSVGSATNKTGGNVGDILVQTGSGTTSFLNAGTAGQVITSNGASPQYVNQSTLSVGSATTATTATNVAGGANGSILVQSGVGTTGQLAIGASGYILTSNGTTPGWSASIPSTSVSGLAASATTDTTDAGNISSGTLGLARLSLATGQFYVGDASSNPAATAKSSIPLSGFGAAGADVAMGGYKLTGLGAPTASTDAATMGYVDSVAQGLDVKASCLVASTADITLSSPGAISIDNIPSTSFTAGTTRILVRAQNTASQNGIYIWNGSSSAMTRSADADTWDELVGAFTFIEQGDTLKDTGWVCTVDAGTLGTTAVTWSQFSGAGSYTANRGLVLSGSAFNFAQNSDYAIGDLPYATGQTTIGLLPAVATGNALISGGVATAPSWGKIGLTTHVSGTLPIANGGTGATSFTQGHVLFAGASTISSSANLFWDNANNRLGIGTATPGATLDINAGTNLNLAVGGLTLDNFTNDGVGITFSRTTDDGDLMALGVCDTNKLGLFSREGLIFATGGAALYGQTSERLRIASDGVCTWSNVGGNSGTAMTLNGTGLGIGTSPNRKLEVAGGSSIPLRLNNTGSNCGIEMLTSSGTTSWLLGAQYNVGNAFEITPSTAVGGTTFSTPAVVVTASGNVAIGQTSSTSRLTVQTANFNDLGISSSNVPIYSKTYGGTTSATRNLLIGHCYTGSNTAFSNTQIALISSNNTAAQSAAIGLTSDNALALYTNGGNAAADSIVGTERLRIDSSGNLGRGVTPSAWFASSKVIQIGNSAIEGVNAETDIYANAYRTVGNTFTYLTNNFATRYQMISGQHIWSTSASGTAGNAITFTPAMTLDASGRLGIGTTTINERLEVYGYGKFSSGWKIDTQGIAYGDTGNSLVIGADPGNASANSSIQLMVDGSEKLRIKSTGQVNFVGLASDPAGAAGDVVYNSTSNRLKYHNGTAWVNTGTNKYSGALTGSGTSFTVTHNLGTRDVTVAVRKSGSTYDQVFTDVQMTDTNTVTIVFASSVTGSDYTVTVIG